MYKNLSYDRLPVTTLCVWRLRQFEVIGSLSYFRFYKMDNRFVTKSPKELTDSPAVEDAAKKNLQIGQLK